MATRQVLPTVRWKLGQNLRCGICSVDQKADDFGGDFSGAVGQSLLSRQPGLEVKPGEAFWKQRYMLCSWRHASVSRRAGTWTEAHKPCPGWAVHTPVNRQNYLWTSKNRNRKTSRIVTALTTLFTAPFGHFWDKFCRTSSTCRTSLLKHFSFVLLLLILLLVS